MIRIGLITLALILLAACRPPADTAPFTESRTPPELAGRYLPPDGWAWGLVQVGEAPAQRYGVSAAQGLARAQIVILPGYGQSAEAWFETARDLNQRGLTVWILERAGQGGSGRFTTPRDLGHAPSFNPDVAATRALLTEVVRPTLERPVTVVAEAEAAAVALLAIERRAPVQRLVLSSPLLDPSPPALSIPGAQDRPPVNWTPWSRDRPYRVEGFRGDPNRARVQQAWQLANPDLRMTGPSPGWRTANAEAAKAALDGLAGVGVPVLVTTDPERDQPWPPCWRLADCRVIRFPGAGVRLHLQRDPIRDAWLQAITAFSTVPAASVGAEPSADHGR